ncbi:DUF1499 domain-containing protein [Szabonella alba]|uniref:DUF1499 domain-containing protein n=1 Tax=Szabonella alba TaxID=2804194 RepID=A0A8K0V9L2_9RHOB|nr:DUF1499 domain-containing protein [Szabonella alba]MBL4917873.1 DUF1499 domain-containing protein [Szabonella alba]
MWAIILLLALIAAAAWIRLAPTDPADWHVALDIQDATGPCGPDAVIPMTGAAQAACLVSGTPDAALARLAGIAEASPRTSRIAGSPEEGRITWVARSALWGFPDYITAEARPEGNGAQLDILSRLRFGRSDLGVNAARLRDWLDRY